MSAIFISHSTKDNADTDAMASWLKKQGHTSYFIDYDEKSGIRAGTDWAQVLYERLRQCQVVIALVTPDWLESKWCFGEMVLARENGKPIFPIRLKPCELPGLLSGIQSIDLTVDKESGYRRLAAGLKQQGLDPADVFDPDLTRPPYPGFPAFEEPDAAVFFGRSAEILSARESFEGLRRHNRHVPRLVLVLGSSGSGKSSLVRAGLIPRLKKDDKNWLPLRPFRPQDELSPLDALAFAIADTYKDLGLPCDSDLLRSRLHSAAESTPVDSGELLKIARELASAADRREATVLVTVDQAEDLLNSGSSETGKTFLQFLGASLSAGDRHLMAVATLRSDSLGAFQNQVASLDTAYRVGLEHRPLTVEPIPIEHYADLIEGPARLTGLNLEDSLVLKLLQDAGQPDSLPLLAFTLRRLYDLHFEGPNANRHAKLTLREYEELGGLAGAVQNAAERIFKERQRTTDEINAFRETFIPGLIRFNDDRSYSRRRAFRHELSAGASSLLAGFVDARILVASADKDGHATVEIAHEALLRTWPTLITWLVEDGDKLRQFNTIVRAAKEWDESGRKSDLLVHRDGRLKDATELISERRFAFLLGSVEHTYLNACATDQQAREAAAQGERDRQLRDAQRLAQEEAKRTQAEAERAQEAEKFAREQEKAASKLRRLAITAAGAAVAAVILLILSVVMSRQSDSAHKAANNAQGRADGLLDFMLIELRDKLIPIGRVNILADVAEKAIEDLDKLPKELVTPPRLRQKGVLLANIGDVLSSQGKLDEAPKAYQQSLEIFKKLAEQEPSNASRQSDLSKSYERVGNVLHDQGDLTGAHNSYRQSLAIREQLAEQDKSNSDWQRDLSVSYNKVGDVLVAQGKLEEGLDLYQQGLTIAKRLAEQDKSNSDWQRDLSVSYEKRGDVLLEQGKPDEALKAYRQSLEIKKKLAEQDKSNWDWQRDLGVSYNKVGDVLRFQGKLNEARDAYQEWLPIARKLAEQDPGNWIWQHDLAVSWERIGYVRQDQNDLTGAAEAYEFELQVFGKLSGPKPKDVGLETDYAESKLDLAGVYRLQGRKESALQLLEQAKNTFIDLQKRAPLSDYQQQVLTRIDKELSALKEAAD